MTLTLEQVAPTVVDPGLTLADAARRIREATKDKSYRATPLGLEVARYIRWFKNEWGAQPEAIRDYESVLARTGLFFADLELRDFEPPVGTERLRECWDHLWGDKTANTRRKVRSVWVSFFDWAIRERGMVGNPARALAAPKKRDVPKQLFQEGFTAKVLVAQDYLPDKLGCILILVYALRRAEVAGVRFRDLDFERRQLTILGKGHKTRTLPIVDESFWRDLGVVQLELQPRPEHFLVHHRRRYGMNTYYQPHKGYVPRSIHTWWYNRLEAAGMVGDRESGTRVGLNLHRGRRTAATDVLRKTHNIVAVSKMLGHSDLGTTIAHYAEFDIGDLAAALRVAHGIEDEG